MKQEEKELENKCRIFARTKGWTAAKMEKNGHKGMPDDVFISPYGKCLFVEFKKDKDAFIRPEQHIWEKRYPNLVTICYDFEDFKKLIEQNSGQI